MLSAESLFNPGSSHALPSPQLLTDPLELYWERSWQENLISTAIHRVKDKVSPKQFQMFHLAVIKRLTTKEVAETLHVTSTQVYLAKHRIGQLVKKEIRGLERQQF